MVIDLTRRMMTNVPKIEGVKAPMKMIVQERPLPDGTSKDKYPNVDVLEFSAWLTVLKEPMVLNLPNVRGRFYCVSLFDAWGGIFHTIGTRTTGEWRGNYALVGRGFKGKLPKGVIKVVCPTNIVRVVGKVQCHLKEDVKVVDELQDRIGLTPLDVFGKKLRVRMQRVLNRYGHHHIDRTISNDIPPTQYIDKMDPIYYFQSLCELMKENPPPTKERPFVEKMGELGMTYGHSYDLRSIDKITHMAIENGTSKARKALVDPPKNPMVEEWDIWTFVKRTDDQIVDHFQRAHNLSVGPGTGTSRGHLQVQHEPGWLQETFRWEQQVHHSLPQGCISTSERFLVHNALRFQELPGEEPVGSVLDRELGQNVDERGWFTGHLYPVLFAR